MTARDQGGTQGEVCTCAPDCAERIDCTLTYVGHAGCGWCDNHNQARHICYCPRETPAPSPTTEGREGGEIEALAVDIIAFVSQCARRTDPMPGVAQMLMARFDAARR